MPTGYEVQMYRDIERVRNAVERFADAMERVANALEREAYGVTGPQLLAIKRRLADESESGE